MIFTALTDHFNKFISLFKNIVDAEPAEFKYKFKRPDGEYMDIHAMLFDYESMNEIGIDGYLICSTEALKRGICTNEQAGRFISNNTENVSLHGTTHSISLRQSGYWCLIHDTQLIPDISIVNQGYHLPAPLLGLLPFYFYMAIAYILFGVYCLYKFKMTLHQRQSKLNRYLFTIVGSSILEMIVAYAFYTFQATNNSNSQRFLYIFSILAAIRNSALL